MKNKYHGIGEREIKFRGKLVATGEWIYWSVLEDIGRPYEILDEKTVAQFTGLLDKQGKEIYEGDIIKIPLNGTESEYCNRTVLYKHGRWAVEVTCGDYISISSGEFSWGKDLEVIGNVFSTPELLK